MTTEIDNEPKLPRFVDLTELSFRLSLQRSAIYALFRAGELTPIKLLPKKTVCLEEEVSAFIQRRFDEARQQAAA
jgi:predicted DNA-binding transcriptional regulator AlpA